MRKYKFKQNQEFTPTSKMINKTITILALVAITSGVIGYQYGVYTIPTPVQTQVAIDTTKPILTVAGIVYVEPEGKFALIQRGKDPKGLAMFGGHVEAKESPEAAFIREAKEELNIDVKHLKLIGLHGQYGRDPRQHSVEGTYFCTTTQLPHAGSDAKAVILYTAKEIETLLQQQHQEFSFDHREILKSFFDNAENKSLYTKGIE